MNNKTILISTNNQNSDTLTNFSNNRSYSDYKIDNKSTFKRRRLKKDNNYDVSNNSFISASSSIFKYLFNIINNNIDEDVHKIKEDFIEKINTYDTLTQKLGLDERECLATRYIICTFIDEMMNVSNIGSNNWSNKSMLSIFHNETYGGENFFHLLDKFLSAPAKYIHILELMYVCLNLGFQGKYRVKNSGSQELQNIKESLFRQIKIVIGKEPVQFYIKQEPAKNKFTLFNKLSYPILFSIIFFLLTIVYFSLTYALYSQNNEFKSIMNKDKTYINTNIYHRVAK